MDIYKDKYLKYKQKYLDLKKIDQNEIFISQVPTSENKLELSKERFFKLIQLGDLTENISADENEVDSIVELKNELSLLSDENLDEAEQQGGSIDTTDFVKSMADGSGGPVIGMTTNDIDFDDFNFEDEDEEFKLDDEEDDEELQKLFDDVDDDEMEFL